MQPGVGGDKFDAASHNGHLLLFFPASLEQNIPTVNGTADAVTTRIVDLDTGQVLDDAKVWGKAMIPQLKGAIPDGMVLGRLAQGQGKGGNNPPWIIQPHTEQDVPRAEQWLAQNPRNQFAQPQQNAAPAPAPANGGWGNPPAQQNGWSAGSTPAAAPAPVPAPSAPTAGWGAPAAATPAPAPSAGVQTQFAGQWGNAAPAPAPAPAPQSQIHPDLVAALARKGQQVQPNWSQQDAEQLWALVQNNPDVA
jgi:hypothetical protein